ncbi:MAG: hypothetical protein BWX99_01905 [Deltaproteobacteria bacterium ADurb.Bin151]|nr:MAG: hypothetical protein BWX99_01905 [Deltaproteobacteria bacterium ADurb.Bin151]HOQ41064.1 hypothetical protein [Smithellaceae bacterium]HPL67927.1 hypothetical protein [Smithellaceae bacterium]
MKLKDVEQDPETHLPGPRLTYAVDDEGKYKTVESVGNSLGTLSVKMMQHHINDEVEVAAERVRLGKESPLAFFMALHIMDCGLLSQYVGIAGWRIKRHLKPSVFGKLKPDVLQRYADFFGVTLEEFIHPRLNRKYFLLGKKDNENGY